MADPDFDLVVIGGGINGAAIARDAATRGLATCLLEQGDLGTGTTRWSSRLIHGGLRYLEFGELGLVHESLTERETLLRNAAHLVRPLPLLIPVYDGSRRALATVDFGLWVYDLLSMGRSVPGHRRLPVDEALAAMPALNRFGLTGAATYYDAQVTYAERLVVENALAARLAGAEVRTRVAVERLLVAAGTVRGVGVRDVLTGDTGTITARAVVNAAGPWVDRVLTGLGRPLPRYLGATKGTHAVVDRFPGLGEGAVYAEARADGRPFFIIPWNGLVLVGTTDDRYDGDPGAVRPTEAELAYLLDEARHIFPGPWFDRERVRYAYAGLRPLPRQGLKETAGITRRHLVRRHSSARGLLSVIGGKLTTHRSLAEEVVDQVSARLDAGGPCTTAAEVLPGGGAARDAVLAELAAYPAVPEASRGHLHDVYGKRAAEVAALTREDPALGQPICAFSGAIGAEVLFAARVEMARTMGDILLRRCMAGLAPDLGRGALPRALDVAARHLGWDAARRAAEERDYAAELVAFTPAITPPITPT